MEESTKNYTVLKDWGDHKAGDVINASQLDAGCDIEALIADGTLAIQESLGSDTDLNPVIPEEPAQVSEEENA